MSGALDHPAEEAASSDFQLDCPLPIAAYDRVVLGHGSGGRLSRDLVRDVFAPAFGDGLVHDEDQAIVPASRDGAIALTTDSFVVNPLFFPGGDIGVLAVNGTVNDLAVGAAVPLYLTAAFILEEGFPMADLVRIAASMRRAADGAGVRIVTGDTKVVERGRGHGVFITTTGIGVVRPGRRLSARRAEPGDRVLLSGTLGDHGVTILASREGIELDTELSSDTAPLTSAVKAVLTAAPGTRCMRDPTRGGLASALNEIAAASHVGITLDERRIPLKRGVRGACELLGLDPLHVANEGKLVAIVPAEEAEGALHALRQTSVGVDAALIGEVTERHPGVVTAMSLLGGERIVPLLAGDQLPRIC
jgi:hydrogenase expression/formation protein HypE